MYAVFEEVVGRPATDSSSKIRNDQRREKIKINKVMRDSSDVSSLYSLSKEKEGLTVISAETGEEVFKDVGKQSDSTSSYYTAGDLFPSDTKRKIRQKKNSIYQSYGIPLNLKQPLDGTMLDSEQSANPLLDTINVLTYDPCEDSDDYYEMGSDYEDLVTSDSANHRPDNPTTEESIGYAGSNSIDSGYKSFCPTPEMADPSVYSPNPSGTFVNADKAQPCCGGHSNLSRVDSGKSKIRMGTKAISRQGNVTPKSPGSRRSDQNLYEVNLDHLMYLRQSLLSAIHKCESSNSKDEPKDENCLNASVGHQKLSESSSCPLPTNSATNHPSTTTTTYQKTVRFNTDIEVSSVDDKKTEAECDSTCSTNKKKDSELPQSILKDPLCENLRSKLRSEASDSTLEEEIDSLLYGRAEFYDLESVDDFPCSYVTMIEEKYRSGKPSLAKVRKLKGVKNQDPSKSNGESDSKKPERLKEKSVDDCKTNSNPEANVRCIGSAARYRFTEVARCMIEIIEDLQLKKLQTGSPTKDTQQPSYRTISSNDGDQESIYGLRKKPKEYPDEPRSSESQCYASASDYHVYEEIAYDFICDKKDIPPWIDSGADAPPPLPARPCSLFQQQEQSARISLAEALSRPDSSRRRGRSLRPRGDMSVRNRPKQRSNLYSLFADQAERRNISRSLERESRVVEKTHSMDPDDEYGFRKPFPSV